MTVLFPISKNNRGFSLPELLLVIALIAILSGISVISIKSNLPEYYLSGAARQVLSDLMLARMQAVSKNTPITLHFVTNPVYTISSEFKGVSFSATGDVIFTPVGTASAATITLSGSGLPSKYVDVSTAGRIRIR